MSFKNILKYTFLQHAIAFMIGCLRGKKDKYINVETITNTIIRVRNKLELNEIFHIIHLSIVSQHIY